MYSVIYRALWYFKLNVLSIWVLVLSSQLSRVLGYLIFWLRIIFIDAGSCSLNYILFIHLIPFRVLHLVFAVLSCIHAFLVLNLLIIFTIDISLIIVLIDVFTIAFLQWQSGCFINLGNTEVYLQIAISFLVWTYVFLFNIYIHLIVRERK